MAMLKITCLASLLIALACSPQPETGQATATAVQSAPAAQVQRHPVSGLEIIEVVVASDDTRHVFRTELAASREEQSRGLMFRTELGDDEAMLFPSQVPGPRSFWMRNTPIPLDIIFIGVDGRISNIAAMTTPYSLESVRSDGLASAVLEIRGGRAAELGIVPGDRVEFTLPN